MRRRSRHMLRSLLGISVALIAAPVLHAGTTGFLRPSAQTPLLAGSRAAVEWSFGAVPGESADEMELLLSLDGGQTFAVRVTGEIDPRASSVEWRVPSRPTSHARLALRIGTDAPGSEAIRLVSEEFTITADPELEPEALFQIDGEWRTREALVVAGWDHRRPRELAPEPDLLARPVSDTALISPRNHPVEPSGVALPESLSCAAGPQSAAERRFPSNRLAPLPLRL